MKQDKQDRRSQRTRRLVTSAMMELLSEKRYEAITVQDILDRAGIGRSTFYSHYYDKEDVHTSVMEQMLETLNQQLSQGDAGQGILPGLELLRHAQQFHQHSKALAWGHAGEKLWEMMQTTLVRIIEETLTSACAETSSPSIPLAVVSQYLAGAFLNLLKWWLGAGMPYTPEEMDRIFRQLALPGVWATLEGKSE